MSHEPVVLYRDGQHQCFLFDELVAGDGVQSNQFLIVHKDRAILIDPGGDLTFNALSVGISKYCDISQLAYIFASHQDPDIISSLDRWIMRSNCKVVTSRLWARFLPHLAGEFVRQSVQGDVFDRVIAVPDEGMIVPVAGFSMVCLPAHFMHSVGNLHFYDPVSKILFSGDLGASIGCGKGGDPVENFENHIQYMIGFHRRYMACNKVLRLWVNMIRGLDVEMIVPQHGRYFKGKAMISSFLDWIAELQCGTDLMDQNSFVLPRW